MLEKLYAASLRQKCWLNVRIYDRGETGMGADTVRSRLRDSALERRRGGGGLTAWRDPSPPLLLLHTFSLTSTELKPTRFKTPDHHVFF